MADKTTTAKTSKKGRSNLWIIGLVLIVLVLGGAGLYQMKQINELQAELKEKENPKGNKNSLAGDDEDVEDTDEDEDTDDVDKS